MILHLFSEKVSLKATNKIMHFNTICYNFMCFECSVHLVNT